MIGGMVHRMTSPVLVGREAVVGQLGAVLDSVLAGHPRHVVIGGEAGVGKTRLLDEARSQAEARHMRVLLGGCVSVGEECLPFAPYAEIDPDPDRTGRRRPGQGRGWESRSGSGPPGTRARCW